MSGTTASEALIHTAAEMKPSIQIRGSNTCREIEGMADGSDFVSTGSVAAIDIQL
jgi:hypothetical protein